MQALVKQNIHEADGHGESRDGENRLEREGTKKEKGKSIEYIQEVGLWCGYGFTLDIRRQTFPDKLWSSISKQLEHSHYSRQVYYIKYAKAQCDPQKHRD